MERSQRERERKCLSWLAGVRFGLVSLPTRIIAQSDSDERKVSLALALPKKEKKYRHNRVQTSLECWRQKSNNNTKRDRNKNFPSQLRRRQATLASAPATSSLLAYLMVDLLLRPHLERGRLARNIANKRGEKKKKEPQTVAANVSSLTLEPQTGSLERIAAVADASAI